MTTKSTPAAAGPRRVTVKIASAAAGMLMNPATPEMLEQLFKGSGARSSARRDLTMQQVADGRIYRDADGRIGIPADNFLACLIEAGRRVKYEKQSMLSTKESSLVPGFIDLEGEFIRFDEENPVYEVSAKRGCLPKDGTAVCIVRPYFPKWSATVSFTFDTTELSEDKVKDLVRWAGKVVGLGDFRPSCRGRYGKFKIADWQCVEHVVDAEEAA